MDDGDDGIEHDHADWAGAVLILKPDAAEKPRTVELPKEPRCRSSAARAGPKPAIHYPRIVGATPGRPFLFLIPATGKGPLTFAAENLPAGLALDGKTGIISGSLKSAGKTAVKMTVKGPAGAATATLTIVGGEHQLALTPPMGWNSWNVWADHVDADKIRAAADAMVTSGLASHGFQYINIDDTWEGKRDADGELRVNDKFKDMKALADYVHAKGLKLGIYSSPGPKTCAGFEGSFGHEEQDAKTYGQWGVDYLKYDWCSCQSKDLKAPYALMRDAPGQIEPRHRLQPLPVRHGRRLDLGRRGRRQLLAHHRRHHATTGAACPASASARTATRSTPAPATGTTPTCWWSARSAGATRIRPS